MRGGAAKGAGLPRHPPHKTTYCATLKELRYSFMFWSSVSSVASWFRSSSLRWPHQAIVDHTAILHVLLSPGGSQDAE